VAGRLVFYVRKEKERAKEGTKVVRIYEEDYNFIDDLSKKTGLSRNAVISKFIELGKEEMELREE
jgi:predicted DNA-binding protein